MPRSGQPSAEPLGIVLAGGAASRLGPVAEATGGGKALLTLHGRTFLERVLETVAAEVSRTIVVAAPGQVLPAVDGASIVFDSMPGSGPLAGLADGLRAALAGDQSARSSFRHAFVASCDLPLLRREIVRLLLDRAAAAKACWTVPVVNGHRQVLTSVIASDMLPRIDAWLATGRRDLRGLLAAIERDDPGSICEVTEETCRTVDPLLASFIDIDTPGDLERLQSR